VIEPGEIRSCPDLHQLVAIEVYEMKTLGPKLGMESALDQYEVRVSLMARPLANDDTLRPELEKRLGGGTNENGVRVHRDACDELDEIRIQQHGFPVKL
jgi:hypothetical protein